jgi:riboflavin kinase / FMN adenylyltransferase
MKLLRGLINTPFFDDGCVVSIGNFDGVHLGHQKMLIELRETATRLRLPLVVIVFEPQPLEYFKGKEAPARVSRLRDKLHFLSLYGVDTILCLHFNQTLAESSPKAFVDKVLFEKLNAKYVMVGEDFRFGHKRCGDFNYLKTYAKSYDCEVMALPLINYEDRRVSSTRIRAALNDGDLCLAKRLLGRDFSMFGRVAHGDKRGRELGIPTANIYLHRLVSPIQGVFCVQVAGINHTLINGVANVGTRPTIDGSQSLLEVHLFDFNQEIYGKNIEVRFIKKLRKEKKFESLDELKIQIFSDINQAKYYFM